MRKSRLPVFCIIGGPVDTTEEEWARLKEHQKSTQPKKMKEPSRILQYEQKHMQGDLYENVDGGGHK